MLDKKAAQEKFIRMVKQLEDQGVIKSRRLLAEAIGWHETHLSAALKGKRAIPVDRILRFAKAYQINNFLEQDPPNTVSKMVSNRQEVDVGSSKDGVLFVPIAAQAGYPAHLNDLYFIMDRLERVYIPGFPYSGDRYRIWEVKGDSMEPTLKEGYNVVTEIVEPTDLTLTPDYYIYVIVTKDQVLIKRIFKKNAEEWIVISDNEDYYPQYILKTIEIQELWRVHRKMDWELSPPKKFEIRI